jgi:hypothetical protein
VNEGGDAGAELGALLGWMSTKVLGQYDLLVLEEEDPEEQDLVYYVGPNILALEKRHGFPPEQFRLWVALHEVTHRTQLSCHDLELPHIAVLDPGAVGTVEDTPHGAHPHPTEAPRYAHPDMLPGDR